MSYDDAPIEADSETMRLALCVFRRFADTEYFHFGSDWKENWDNRSRPGDSLCMDGTVDVSVEEKAAIEICFAAYYEALAEETARAHQEMIDRYIRLACQGNTGAREDLTRWARQGDMQAARALLTMGLIMEEELNLTDLDHLKLMEP